MQTLYTKGQSFRWMRLLTLLLLWLPFAGRAQYSITTANTPYNQSFDAFAGTLATQPPSWTYSGSDYNPGGYYNRASPYINSNSTYGLRESATATDVAFGTKLGTTEVNNYDFAVTNNTGAAITSFSVSWDIEQYSQDTRPTSIDFSYSLNGGTFGTTGVTGTTLTAASTGTSATTNLAAVAVTSRSITITGIALANGQNAVFRYIFKGNNGGGSNAHIGLDNFSLTANPSASVTPAEINVKQGTTTYLTASTYSGFASTTVGNSDAKTFTIENLGGTVLNISTIAATSNFSVSGAPTTVAANGTADVTVTFTPTAAGTRTGTLTINSDDADEAAYVINLSATATATAPNPLIAVSQAGTPYANASTFSGFANTAVGSTSPTVTFTITNSSTTDALVISGITTTSNFAVSGTAPTTVAANSTATFDLTFTPTASGTRTGTVTIANNSQGSPSYAISLSGTGVAPAPTLTAIDPANPVGGATYDFTLTGTGFGTIANTTVSFNGTTVTPASVTGGGTTLTVALPLPAAGGTFPITVTTANGTSGAQSLTVTAAPAGFFEPFEPSSQGTYTATPTAVALRTGSYDFVQTVLGSLANDKYNNTQSARLRGGGSITMGFDKAGGAGVVTISAALYGAETGAGLALEYSTNGGTSFTAAPGSPATLTSTLTPYTFTLNVPGAVRLRISTTNATGGSNPRINIDDLQIADYTAAACNAPTGLAAGSITSNSASVSFTGSGSATGYTVTTMPLTTTQTLAAGATSVAFSGLTPGTAYTVSIVSNCAGGATSSAATVSFTTLAAAPALVVTQAGTPIANGANPSYSFGSRTTGTTQSAMFTLTNTGPDPLTISAISASNAAVFSFNALALPVTVAANGGTVSLTVIYNVGTGPQSGSVTITSDAANGNASFQLNVNGTGVPAAANPLIAVSQGATAIANGSTYSGFFSQVATTSGAVTFMISNPSTTDALVLGPFVLSGPFFLSGTQPATIAPGSNATFDLRFLPTAPGTATGTLSIPNNSQANNPYLINLSGQGLLADLVVSNTQTIGGSYNNVTITPSGRATMGSTLTVYGTLTVQGTLDTNCNLVSGTGSFVLAAGGRLDICDAAGITASGPTGAIQLSGSRSYSPDAIYYYTSRFAQVTGNGLPAQIQFLTAGNGTAGNPGGLTLSQGLSISRFMMLFDCNLITAGQPFTLLSSATATASVFNNGGVVVGTATVQRYIGSSNGIGYRHYSAPVSNTTLADLAAPGFTPVFTQAYNSSPTPGAITPFPTVFGYDQGRVGTVTSTYSNFDKGWFSPTAGDAMVVGRGYTANVPNSALVDFVGTLNNGNQSSGALSRSTAADAGWHLLGNPYPAVINWSTVTAAQRPGMDAAMYVFQSSGQYGGSYRSFANGVGVPNGAADAFISSSTGYFVRVSTPGGSGAVNLTNSNREISGSGPVFGRSTADVRPQLYLQLRGATATDDLAVYFQAGATAGVDTEFDAVKLPNPTGLNLTSLAGGEALAINGLPALGTATVLVPLNVAAPQAGSYSLTAGSLANLAGTTVTLIDGLTSTRTVLATGTAYAFSLSSTTATGRFTLEFRPTGALATTAAQALAAQLQVFPNPASGSFRVQLPLLSRKAAVSATLLNALGQTVLSRSLSVAAGQGLDAEFDVRGLAAGVYTLRLNVDGTPVTRKLVVE